MASVGASESEKPASNDIQKLAAANRAEQKPKVVSQEGFDYVLDAMNGEDNMKEETKDYKPATTSNFRFNLWRR